MSCMTDLSKYCIQQPIYIYVYPTAGPKDALCFLVIGHHASVLLLGTMSALSTSVCADTLLPAELNQSPNGDLHSRLMLCTNQTNWAATHRLNTASWQPITHDRLKLPAPYRPEKNNKGSSYLPTVWLASCLIRLNCFFILCFSALPPGGRGAPHISLIG